MLNKKDKLLTRGANCKKGAYGAQASTKTNSLVFYDMQSQMLTDAVLNLQQFHSIP